MKIRSGFVSNSSSTSFTCDCCGETQSGMDMSRSDAGMQECQNGHTFCESHALKAEISPDVMREALIRSREKWRNATWKKPGEVDAEIAQIKELSDNVLQDQFDELCYDIGCVPEDCPICQMQNMCDGDVVRYALKKLGYKKVVDLAAALKAEFKTYDAFKEYLKS